VHHGLNEAAPAKVNLFLHVLGTRADGYHELDSLAVFPGAADGLRADPADGLTLEIEGPFGAALSAGPDNLVLRAAVLLAEAAGVRAGARLRLQKNLPVASGIGGGSADAAAALRLLARLWRVPDGFDLERLAARIGADVPVCLASRPARMRGVGEKLDPAPEIPECGFALVNPGVPVATADVFRALRGSFSHAARLPDRWRDAAAMARDLAVLSNDLEASAIALCPVIAEALAALRAAPGCLLARMSGSGATCFGLFPNAKLASHAASTLGSAPWWSWGGPLLPVPQASRSALVPIIVRPSSRQQ
jgi:4-diphosphocytidyl-2-C-methyl-D-erythritol kinase